MTTFSVQLDINSNLYMRDPQSSSLGRRIVEHSVLLIDQLGLEQFNFKKLAKEISSTEASIYRYFENKHHLFVYLLNWYWEWMIARIKLNTLHIADSKMKLRVALGIVIDTANRNMDIEFVDEAVLHKIVVSEGAKAYHHKFVDEDNEDGFFLSYKELCNTIAKIIIEVNSDFPYPKAFASTLVESANNNLYYARHLPRLTDLDGSADDESLNEQVKKMIEFFCFGMINQNTKP
jgi:AcrR family transcriptional regulator